MSSFKIYMAPSKHVRIYTHLRNAVPLVWGGGVHLGSPQSRCVCSLTTAGTLDLMSTCSIQDFYINTNCNQFTADCLEKLDVVNVWCEPEGVSFVQWIGMLLLSTSLVLSHSPSCLEDKLTCW